MNDMDFNSIDVERLEPDALQKLIKAAHDEEKRRNDEYRKQLRQEADKAREYAINKEAQAKVARQNVGNLEQDLQSAQEKTLKSH